MSKWAIGITWDDVPHLSQADKDELWSSIPEHEREARAKGIPALGSGRVFPIAEELIKCEPFPIPRHWVQINGLDFGWDHPFAATNCAWDRDADVFYVCKEFASRQTTPVFHAGAIKPWGLWIPCAWPADGLQHDKGSGKPLRDQYAEQGLNTLAQHAQFASGSNSVEAGVTEMLDRMNTGRFKVFSTCPGWFNEFRMYHREEGKIVKLMDDIISSSRYAHMMRRFAIIEPANEDEDRDDYGRSGTTGY
jgi:hypothetical protein